MDRPRMGLLRRCCHVLLLIFCGLAFNTPAQTPNPAYLADMPSIDRVKAQIQGKDPTVSATCSVNTFSSKSPAEYRALITNPPAPRP